MKRRTFIVNGTFAIIFGKSILNEITKGKPKKEIITNYPTKLYVSQNGTGSGLGWDDPTNIENACEMSGPLTTIYVKNGIYEYPENINLKF